MAYEVFGVLANAVPVGAGKVIKAVLDTLEQELLTIRTFLATIPTAVAATLARKRTFARQHDVDDDAQTPQVAAFVVGHVIDEGLHHLGR